MEIGVREGLGSAKAYGTIFQNVLIWNIHETIPKFVMLHWLCWIAKKILISVDNR